jgi:Flp pilus assembly protein TadD
MPVSDATACRPQACPPNRASAKRRSTHRACALLLAAAGLVPAMVQAQSLPGRVAAQPGEPRWAAVAGASQGLDQGMFLQLLLAELELREGRYGEAYARYLDAARRANDEGLYERAVEIALRARAGNEALAAARAWRTARPQSVEAIRYETQILLALNRVSELATPLAAWLAQASVVERASRIEALTRQLQRATDRREALALVERLVEPYRDAAPTRVASLVVVGHLSLTAGDAPRALALAREAQAHDPGAHGPVLLALELLNSQAEAESLVKRALERPQADPALRMAYARALMQSQRYADALVQVEAVTRDRASDPAGWFTAGALHLELKQAAAAQAALLRYLDVAATADAAAGAQPTEPSSAGDPELTDTSAAGATRDLTGAYLMLAQAAEMRGDLTGAESWLARVDQPRRALEVQSRRASLAARKGRWDEARTLIQAVPERSADDARAKLMAEAQLLREFKRWKEAAQVLATANQRYADDVDLLYEQAMAEEKVERFDDMERLLRRVIELRPAHSHAHNALGYSLADRGVRLPEARELIRRALELSPGDPFITDSLGWVEYRMGNLAEAARLLRQAYRSRPDTEIAAHLGEVLWAMNEHDEARRIWSEGRQRDAGNDVLRDTLRRLRVSL